MKFKYAGDLFSFRFKKPHFHSTNYEFSFNSFSEYWMEVGKRGALVSLLISKSAAKQNWQGFSEREVNQKLARLELGVQPGVILSHIDLEYAARIAERFPGVKSSIFSYEYVVVPTRDKEAALKLMMSIPTEHAVTDAYGNGLHLGSNTDCWSES